MLVKIFLAGALAVSASSPAGAADWRLTAVRQTSYGLSVAFIDANSIIGGYGEVQFSGVTFFSRQTRQMNRVAVIVRAHCGSMVIRSQQITTFRNQQPIGLWHSAFPTAARQSTNIFDQVSAACGRSEFGPSVAKPEIAAAAYFKRKARRRIS